MDNQRDLLRNQLIGLLDQFVVVCEKYNLRYYLAYGTVLGAVRHKGIIPWDDDIDVCLMREDYERLQLLPDSVWGDNMRLTSWKKASKNHYHFVKIELTNTTVIEQFNPIYVGGVYLDVFPLDVVPDDLSCAANQVHNIHNYFMKYYLINATLPKSCTSFYHLIKYRVKHFLYVCQHIQDKWEKEATLFIGENGNKIACFHSEEFARPMERAWFADGKMMMFEGKEYRVPADTDAYLTYLYGDFMTPPPFNEREGHSFLYINLNKRLDGNELRKVKKNVKQLVSYDFNIKKELNYIKLKLFGH